MITHNCALAPNIRYKKATVFWIKYDDFITTKTYEHMPSLITRKDTAHGATLVWSRPAGTKGDTRTPPASPLSPLRGLSVRGALRRTRPFLTPFSLL